jgi:hypothetical protein
MAQIVFALNGIKKDLDEVVKWLETRVFMLPVKEADGKETTLPVTANLQPIQFFKYSIPKEAMPSVIKALNPKTQVNLTDGKGKHILKNSIKLIRKMLGLKPIPKVDENVKGMLMPDGLLNNIRVIGVGYKDDITMTFPNNLTHEAI